MKRFLALVLAVAFSISPAHAWLDVPSLDFNKVAKSLYTSSPTDAVVNGTLNTGASNRASMLPADIRTGNALIFVPAGMMPIGTHLMLVGTGTIGARLTTPPGFNFIPWVKPATGSKTDLTGFAKAPLLGTDGTCEIWMKITQTAQGVRTSGIVRYGATDGQAYSLMINPGGTGASGVLPDITASDPNVDRTFGVDGFWGAGADAREYVKARSVTVDILPGY